MILCEGLGCVGITQDGDDQGQSGCQGQNDACTKNGVAEVDSYGDSCSYMEYWGRGAQNSLWGRWGLTRLQDSNSKSSDESLRGVREKGNKNPSLKNKNSKSKVNFKPRRKTKYYYSIKEYFTSRPTQEVG